MISIRPGILLAALLCAASPVLLVSCNEDSSKPDRISCSISANPSSGEAPLEVLFQATVDGGTPPLAFQWDFGDGEGGTQQSPGHPYENPGDYVAGIDVTDASGESCHSEIVIHVLEAQFTCNVHASVTTGPTPLTVDFTGTAEGGQPPLSFSWDFGDGGSSQHQNPTHTYTYAGVFDAILIVTDASSRTCESAVGIEAQEPAFSGGVTATPVSGPAPLTVSFVSEITGGTAPFSFFWDFGDGGTSNQQNPVHIFATPGTYPISMTVTDAEARTCDGSVSIEVQ